MSSPEEGNQHVEETGGTACVVVGMAVVASKKGNGEEEWGGAGVLSWDVPPSSPTWCAAPSPSLWCRARRCGEEEEDEEKEEAVEVDRIG